MSPSTPAIVLAPDKFKGSLSAMEVCEAMSAGLRRVLPDVDIRSCPMADGGDGTLDAILRRGGRRCDARVAGADGNPRRVDYGIVPAGDGDVAVIEAARIVGLTDARATQTPLADRSTLGIGELMAQLLARGIRRFTIGLGGSSTNDGGAGLLAGLGVRALDADGAPVPPTARGLARLGTLDASGLVPAVREAEITILSDVDNPLCGPAGATAVFGPQKGAGADEVPILDATLANFAACSEAAFGRTVATQPGAGAAGGLGFALLLIGARRRPGAEAVAEIIGLDDALRDAAWLITGEGRGDRQTLHGKAPWEAARRARMRGVPATLLCGALDPAALPELNRTFAGCFALPDGPLDRDASLGRAATLLADRIEAIARLWQAARGAGRGSL